MSHHTVTGPATNLDRVLDRNRAFAATDARTEVPALPFLPRQELYLITCLDCRVDPAQVLGIGLGDALVQRNIGGRVTPSVLGDIAYAAYLVGAKAPEGPWFEVAVIHHTDCGSGLLADEPIRRGYAELMGVDERTLADVAVLDPAKTVAADVERVRRAPHIPDRVQVSGHVYDVETGLVTTVVPAGR
ncbi:carbonic anhydrase [Amycolatopsis sp. PS_44_ISF1]|uniref:carbonic anhydrase n=1 Tax=Amycolatopsis sp. PS_44_ISF1 TaxID=2974917 RepID=UPI0028DEFB30|nr:carbonic anhydrase [Amycolatopsis sp. PS_44_ISF1]MDT8911421.1 carbonic anhydrase [Amycolatopsis sp. PS_44_ISF1]